MMGVDVLGWVVFLVLGAGWGVLDSLTAGRDVTLVTPEGRLLDRGRSCSATRQHKRTTQISGLERRRLNQLMWRDKQAPAD